MKTLTTVVAVVVLFAGCSRSREARSNEPSPDAPKQAIALVRFVDAMPAADHVDLWFGDARIFSNAAYKDVTAYTEVPAERHAFKVQTADAATPPASDSEGLSAGAHYTVIVTNARDGKMKVRVIRDDLTMPAAGMAKMRIINATAGETKLAIVDRAGEMFSGVESDANTSYKQVQPGKETIEVRHGANKADALRIPGFNIDPANIYTIIITGGGSRPLEATPVVDQKTTAPTGA
jgi:hypothetical protein